MPISNRNDAVEVEHRIGRIFAASSALERAAAVRGLFVEVLDFDAASGQVSLANAPSNVTLPPASYPWDRFDRRDEVWQPRFHLRPVEELMQWRCVSGVGGFRGEHRLLGRRGCGVCDSPAVDARCSLPFIGTRIPEAA